MEGASSAKLMDVTEKKRLQNRMAQQKYRNRLKERIRQFEELKKHIGNLPDLKDHVDAAYSPPSTNIQTETYNTESEGIGLLPDQAVSAPEPDHCLWGFNCPPMRPVQSGTHPGISPNPALDFLSSTFQNLDHSRSSLSSEPQPHLGPCACGANQWPCTLFAPSPGVSGAPALHQAMGDNQFTVTPGGHPSYQTSCEEQFIHILNTIHQTGYESIEKMIAEYYTANFKADTVAHWLQKSSRRYRLPRMLENIYRHSQAWPEDERMVFHEALVCIAARVRTAQNQCMHMRDTTF